MPKPSKSPKTQRILVIYRDRLNTDGQDDPVGLLFPSSPRKPFPGRLKTLDEPEAAERGERAQRWINEYNDPSGRKLLCQRDRNDDVELWEAAAIVISSGAAAFTGAFDEPIATTIDALFALRIGRMPAKAG